MRQCRGRDVRMAPSRIHPGLTAGPAFLMWIAAGAACARASARSGHPPRETTASAGHRDPCRPRNRPDAGRATCSNVPHSATLTDVLITIRVTQRSYRPVTGPGDLGTRLDYRARPGVPASGLRP
jgi:hypothetical protein